MKLYYWGKRKFLQERKINLLRCMDSMYIACCTVNFLSVVCIVNILYYTSMVNVLYIVSIVNWWT